MRKRIFAVFIAVAMLIGMVPSAAFAAQTGETPAVTNGAYTDGAWASGGTGEVTYQINGEDVVLSKTAVPVAGEENVFDITLKVQTQASETLSTDSAAVVLVMDVSNSMDWCAECGGERSHKKNCKYYNNDWMENWVTSAQSRMQAAKDAAKTFLASYAGTDASANRQLCIVAFGSNANTLLSWSNVAGGADKNNFNNTLSAINRLGTNGGTNLEAGLSTANTQLSASGISGIASKSVVLLTDGKPTYRIDGGNGSDGSQQNCNAAKNAADKIKANGKAELYTVCFGAANETAYSGGPTVGNFLSGSIASSASYAYNADNSAALAAAFKAISESITSGLDGEGLQATDPMGRYVSVVSGASDTFVSDGNGTYTWSLTDADVSTSGSTTTYTYTYTYRIKLDVQGQGFVEGQYYPTNGETYLTVEDETYAFPVPGVKGTLPRTQVTANKVWADQDDQDGIRPQSVKLQLKKDGVPYGASVTIGARDNWSYTWEGLIAKSGGVTHVYSVEEVDIPTDYGVAYGGSAANGLTVTNTHEVYTVDVDVKKIWDDNDDQDGLRPDAITVELYADKQYTGKTVTLNDANQWKASFTGLDKNKAGNEINYTVAEAAVPRGYEARVDGYIITNVHEPATMDLPVTKVWEDARNQDGIRPEAIEVMLLANGNETNKTVSLNENNQWTASFTDLAVYAKGQPIQYAVQEVNLPKGYNSEINGSMQDGFEITNTHEVEKITVSGAKTWQDADNQDNIRPDFITIRLLANGQEVASKTVTAQDNWQWSFENMDKNANGQAINYTVTEDAVTDYSTSYSYNGVNVTNTHSPKKTSVTVTKAWEDEGDQDGIRPNDVTVELLADGEGTSKTLTLNKGNGWTASFEQLDVYAAGKVGQAVNYTVRELNVPKNYIAEVTGSAKEGYVITNRHTPEVVTVSGTKTWDDAGDNDGKRPDEVTVSLLANGRKIDEAKITGQNGWRYAFENLPKYQNHGQLIQYNVVETAVKDYSTSYHLDSYDIKNTHTPEQTSVTVTKAWLDQDDQDGIRPDEITVYLMADGQRTNYSLTLNADNNWTGTFGQLPVYKAGDPVAYTVSENGNEGYSSEITGNMKEGFVITNIHEVEKVTVSGGKTWDDANDQEGKRPDSITIRLLADGRQVAEKTVTQADGWQWTFEDLDKNDKGRQISYTIVEDAVEGYTASVEGYDVTNTYAPEKTSVMVVKAWSDSDNADGLRPDSVTIRLLADGKDTGKTLTLSAANQWAGVFGELDVYAAGERIAYTVEEVAVEHYNAVITGDATVGFVVTNSHSVTPKTGDSNMIFYLALLAVSALGVAATCLYARKRSLRG